MNQYSPSWNHVIFLFVDIDVTAVSTLPTLTQGSTSTNAGFSITLRNVAAAGVPNDIYARSGASDYNFDIQAQYYTDNTKGTSVSYIVQWGSLYVSKKCIPWSGNLSPISNIHYEKNSIRKIPRCVLQKWFVLFLGDVACCQLFS